MDGKLIMFLAIYRASKFTNVEFHDHAGKMEGAAFLRNVVAAFPYKIHTVLTDNGMAFADLPKNRSGPSRRLLGAVLSKATFKKSKILKYHAWI